MYQLRFEAERYLLGEHFHPKRGSFREVEEGFSDGPQAVEGEEDILAAPQGFEPRYADPESDQPH